MICWAIKHKGKGYVDENDNYGKLIEAELYPTKAEAQQNIKETKEEVVKIEIRILD